MNKTTRFLARWRWAPVATVLLLLVALLLAGCGAEPTAVPTEPPAPTEVAAEPPTPTSAPTEPPTPTTEPTEVPPSPTPEPTATEEPIAEPTPEPIDDSGCITCHTDDATLQALATEPEEPEVESEGEG
jgi:outer membrane biosynthesis protein TonB